MLGWPLLAFDTATVNRWPMVASALLLGLVWLGFRLREDLAEAMGFADADVALLTMGALAGPVLSVPVWIVQDAIFAVNLGGALIPMIVVWRLRQRGSLPLAGTLLATLPVAAAAWWIVEIVPNRGVVAGFPAFLLPPAVALVASLALTRGQLAKAGPIALASGTLGALVGADLVAIPQLVEVARTADPGTALVLGGGGAFDLVFLSGALSLGAILAGAIVVTDRPAPLFGHRQAPVRVPGPRRVLTELENAPGLSPRERCLVGLAKANLALETDRFELARRHARDAADALLSSGRPRLVDRIREGEGVPELSEQLRELHEATSAGDPAWVPTADAVEHVKHLAGRLWPHAEGRVRPEEWTR